MDNLDCYENINFFTIFLKSIIISVFVSLLLILILSFFISNTSLKESIINPSVIFISAISILIGGFLVSKKVRKKGILYGALVGLIYMLVMYLISSLINLDFSINLNSVIMIGFGILGGAVGGILGVNL